MSIEELVRDLQKLTPDQLDRVASVVREFSLIGERRNKSGARITIPLSTVDEAVRHSWPPELFTEVIGSLPELERAPQPAYDVRETP